jgi:hypothetical protein
MPPSIHPPTPTPTPTPTYFQIQRPRSGTFVILSYLRMRAGLRGLKITQGSTSFSALHSLRKSNLSQPASQPAGQLASESGLLVLLFNCKPLARTLCDRRELFCLCSSLDRCVIAGSESEPPWPCLALPCFGGCRYFNEFGPAPANDGDDNAEHRSRLSPDCAELEMPSYSDHEPSAVTKMREYFATARPELQNRRYVLYHIIAMADHPLHWVFMSRGERKHRARFTMAGSGQRSKI